MKAEDEEKAKIGQQYIKELFEKTGAAAAGPEGEAIADEKARQQERLVVFNEFASDAML